MLTINLRTISNILWFVTIKVMVFGFETIFRIALVALGAYTFHLLLMQTVGKVLETIDHGITAGRKKERIKTLRSIVSNLLSFGIGATALLIILSEVGVDIAPLIAGLGVLGLGIGLAAQTLVKDYISGFFIFFENQFNVGDEVEVAGKRGVVEELTLRFTVLKDEKESIEFKPSSFSCFHSFVFS